VSSWTAFFSNGWRGTEAFPAISYLARMVGCRGLRVVAVRDSMDAAPAKPASRYGGLILELYGPWGRSPELRSNHFPREFLRHDQNAREKVAGVACA
jgi:hypothetical protein